MRQPMPLFPPAMPLRRPRRGGYWQGARSRTQTGRCGMERVLAGVRFGQWVSLRRIPTALGATSSTSPCFPSSHASPHPGGSVMGAVRCSPNTATASDLAPCSAAPSSRSSRAEVAARIAQRRGWMASGAGRVASSATPRHHSGGTPGRVGTVSGRASATARQLATGPACPPTAARLALPPSVCPAPPRSQPARRQHLDLLPRPGSVPGRPRRSQEAARFVAVQVRRIPFRARLPLFSRYAATRLFLPVDLGICSRYSTPRCSGPVCLISLAETAL